MTFISQNYAKGRYDRCRKTTRIAMATAVISCALVATTFFLFRYPLLHIFSNDPKVIRFAVIRMTFITVLEPLTATYEITGSSLRGIGHSLTPALLTLFGSCILRIIYIHARFGKFTSFSQVAVIYPISWILTGSMVIGLYFLITGKEYRKKAGSAS